MGIVTGHRSGCRAEVVVDSAIVDSGKGSQKSTIKVEAWGFRSR
jgi:hypothetical protein